MNQALGLASKVGPITVDDIRNIHRRLLSATDQVRYAGVLRNQQNWLGGINPCRALVHLVLRRRGIAPRYIPPISLILATHAPIYVAGLTSYRYSGLADSAETQTGILRWLDVFVSDTLRACNDARDLMRKMEELQSGWRQKMGRIRVNSSVDVLLKQCWRAAYSSRQQSVLATEHSKCLTSWRRSPASRE